MAMNVISVGKTYTAGANIAVSTGNVISLNCVGIDSTTGKVNDINSTNFKSLAGGALTGIIGGISAIQTALCTTSINSNSASLADVTGATLTITPTVVEDWIIIGELSGWDSEASGNTTQTGKIAIDLDGSTVKTTTFLSSNLANANTVGVNSISGTIIYYAANVSAASHTAKLRWACKATNHQINCDGATRGDLGAITVIRIPRA